MYVLSLYLSLFHLAIRFEISNEIVIVCFKICAFVHNTAKLKVIHKDGTSKAFDKPLRSFWSKHSGVI